jgi:hypothetical protein
LVFFGAAVDLRAFLEGIVWSNILEPKASTMAKNKGIIPGLQYLIEKL